MGDMRFEHRMSDSDALMWSIEKDPMLRSTITAVVVLDEQPDPARLRDLVDRGTRLVPRMRQRVRSNPLSIAPPRWEVDPNFDLDFHLRFVRAGGDRRVRSVLDLAEPIAMQGFDRARPLWEITVVDGIEDDRAAVILKVHHAITDGVGAVQIALVMFELERATGPLRTCPPRPRRRCSASSALLGRDRPRAPAQPRHRQALGRHRGRRHPLGPRRPHRHGGAGRRDAASVARMVAPAPRRCRRS